MTLITVTIPTYNRDAYLKEALESVLAQTVSDLEIIVSDNANSATTQALVRSYDDSRVAYAPLLENIGVHGNLTRCLHLGSAPYVAVLPDDDTMYPGNLEQKLAVLEAHPTAGVAHSAVNYVDGAGEVTMPDVNWTGSRNPAPFESGREFIERAMSTGTRICVSSALVRRSAVAHLCHDARDGSASDFGLWLRIATAWDVAFLNESLTTFRLHAESASREIGIYDFAEDHVKTTLPLVATTRRAKMRFLDEYVTNPRDRAALRRRVRDCARTGLKNIVATDTLSERKSSLTARHLHQAAQIEPSLWWSPWSAVLLASSVCGKRLFDTLETRKLRP